MTALSNADAYEPADLGAFRWRRAHLGEVTGEPTGAVGPSAMLTLLYPAHYTGQGSRMWLLQADDPTAAQGLLSTREVYERIPESAHRLITDAILDTLDLTWQEAMDDAAPLLAGEGSAAARMAVLAQTAEACSGMRAELDDLRHAGVVKDSRFKGNEFVSDQYDGPARAASAVVQITCRPCAGTGPAAVRRALQPLRSKPVTVVVAPSTPHSGSITVTMHIAAAPLSAAQRLTVQLRELLDRSDQIATVGAPTLTHPYA